MPCTALVADIQYDHDSAAFEANSNAMDLKLSCETPNGTFLSIPIASSGWIKEKMIRGDLQSGHTQLEFPSGIILLDSETGSLQVSTNTRARSNNNIFRAPSSSGATQDADTYLRLINGPTEQRRLSVIGTKKVLVVRVIAQNDSTTASAANLSDSVFGTLGDTVTLKSQYSACSHGQIQFVPATGNGINNGVIEVTVSTVNTSQGDSVMNNAIGTKLSAQFGTFPNSVADHVMYCLPPNTMIGIAYAYVNSWLSVYSDSWCTYVSAQMHGT